MGYTMDSETHRVHAAHAALHELPRHHVRRDAIHGVPARGLYHCSSG
jgi:hypothetical protein